MDVDETTVAPATLDHTEGQGVSDPTIEHQNNPMQNPLLMCGYLMKRSTKGEWNKRYFETSGNHLVYYKNIKMQKMLAAIALRQVGSIKVLAENLQDRTLVLRADSLQSAEKWVTCLTAIRDGQEGAPPTHRAGELLGSMASESGLSDMSRISAAHSMNGSGSEYTLGPLLRPTAKVKKVNRHSRFFCCCC